MGAEKDDRICIEDIFLSLQQLNQETNLAISQRVCCVSKGDLN
jgi:hypothetical protein